MARMPRNEEIYRMADTFRRRCLTQDFSFLWPDQRAWTVTNLNDFWDAFVGHPDESNKPFLEKWENQLAGQPDDVIRIASDITAFYGLFPSKNSLGAARKTELVHQVRKLRSNMSEPDPGTWNELVRTFEQDGVGSTGTHYNTGRPFQMAFYLGFGLQLKTENVDLDDWRACKNLADKVRQRVKDEFGETPSLARNIMLHLLFPEYFEDTSSDDHKRRMFDAFRESADIPADTDVDDGIYQVRQQLESKYDRKISFYEPEIRKQWDSGYSPKLDDADLPTEDEPHPVSIGSCLESLSSAVYLTELFLQEINDLLLDKRQLIFEGPPGSGKTFVAEKFARWFTGQSLDEKTLLNEQVEIVQFHQSYGYEDFVQGIRPETNDDGQLVYKVREGIFLKLCALATSNPDKRFVLIIDEINRGNLSRIFGELLLLLEYRGMSVQLPYGSGDQAKLNIPENLFLIGTMNTADRSLSQIDYALRRRFYFVRFMPVENGRAEVFEKWLATKDFEGDTQQRVLDLFVSLNRGIREHLSTDDLQIGHSYFMQDDIVTGAGLDRVWHRAVRPLLEEYLHHHRNRDEILEDLTPNGLRRDTGEPVPANMTSLEDGAPDIDPDQL